MEERLRSAAAGGVTGFEVWDTATIDQKPRACFSRRKPPGGTTGWQGETAHDVLC